MGYLLFANEAFANRTLAIGEYVNSCFFFEKTPRFFQFGFGSPAPLAANAGKTRNGVRISLK
jgi:hypothetical protein